MTKKKVLIHTDFSLSKTGFGRNAKALLSYLYKTNKYDLVHYACGINIGNPILEKTPWLTIGSIPNDQKQLELIQKDPNQQRLMGYGAFSLDKAIVEQKPDIYIAVQDFWGVDFSIGKKWFDKITSVIWVTLDSLPILPTAVQLAPKIKNYWVWSSFAEKELHRLGHKQVKTVHGCVDERFFYALPKADKKELRKRFGIEENAFVIGFVFRNQLRKSVPNLIEGFKLFKERNPLVKNPKLFLHTSWTEGWGIGPLAAEYGISNSEILTTYICHACNQYQVKSYSGEEQRCPYCKNQKTQHTTNVGKGVTEAQLNEIYNLFSVYCHPFTSGGLEIPIIEAKLCELITLVTNYSSGEELCEVGSCSLPLDWSEYREIGTQFKKASTFPSSIAKQLSKVYELSSSEKEKLGKKSKEWALQNYSVQAIGKRVEDFLDSCPKITNNPNYQPDENLNNVSWLLDVYENMLNIKIDETNEEFRKTLRELT